MRIIAIFRMILGSVILALASTNTTISQADTATLFVSDAGSQTLYTLSTVDATTTLVGGFGTSGYMFMAGLAYDISNDILYGSTTGYPDTNLYSIDYHTGAATVIGPFGNSLSVHGLAYDQATGTLLGAAWSGVVVNLYNINVATGAATAIGVIGSSNVVGLAFDPFTNVLYGAAYNAETSEAFLLTIDKTTGATSVIGPTQSLQGIAFDPATGELYGVDNGLGSHTGGLFTINKATGSATLVGTFSLENALGLEFIGPIRTEDFPWEIFMPAIQHGAKLK